MQWIVACGTVSTLLITTSIIKFVKDLKAVDNLPGLRCLLEPFGIPGVIIPTNFWNPGLGWIWQWRTAGPYERFKSDTISIVSCTGRPYVYTRSIEVASQCLNNSSLIKSLGTTNGLREWGPNLVASEHDVYKRHRRVVGPAFGSTISPVVWNETSKVYKEMVADEGWLEKSTVILENFNPYLHKLALILISRCGFGLPFSWTVSESSKSEMELGKCMSGVTNLVAIRTAAPRWMYKLPIKALWDLDMSFKTLDKLMRLFIAERFEMPTEDKESKQDLFSRLLQANEQEGNEKAALSDDELMSNVFGFLFAGHETTARSMTVTLAYLAAHPEEQEIAVKDIQRVLVNGRDPVFEDYDSLSKVKACFVEATRLFPPGYLLPRDAEDSIKLITPTDKGDKTIVLAPGTRVIVDMIGICYNPKYFEEPTLFKPSRWYDRPESDLPFFGLGNRACIGRKFAMAEAVCLLTLVLRDWVVSPLLRDGETVREWEDRVIRLGEMVVTLGVGRVPLKLTRRV